MLYHVTRTPVSNVWSCTDVQRTRHSAACSVKRWKMGRAGCSRWSVGVHFTATWPPCVKVTASEAFPAGGSAPRYESSALAGMRYSSPPALQDARAPAIQRHSLVEDKRHVDVQRLFCTIFLGRHIGLAAMDSYDARHDRLSRIEGAWSYAIRYM